MEHAFGHSLEVGPSACVQRDRCWSTILNVDSSLRRCRGIRDKREFVRAKPPPSLMRRGFALVFPLRYTVRKSKVAKGSASGGPAGRKIKFFKYFMQKAYCVKEKKMQEMKNGKEVTMKNGRKAMKGECSSCGTGMYSILPSKKK